MTLSELNLLNDADAAETLTRCCGASQWVRQMIALRPFHSEDILYQRAEDIWRQCTEKDWLEAFSHHPKIGDIESLSKRFSETKVWAENEQQGARTASRETIEQLAAGNAAYEEKFGFIFIVCATGKSAAQMLDLLQKRLPNERAVELKIAAAEQQKITLLRLEKLLA